MSSKLSSRIVVAVAALALAVGACKNSNSPDDLVIDDFVSGLSGTDGSNASRASGSPPAASGGPAATASTVGTTGTTASVISGGSNLVRLRAGSPFQTVYLAVTASPVADYYKLNLNSATTDTSVIVAFGREIPENTFQTIFSLSPLNGSVGASSSITNTVNTAGATGNVQVQASWDANSDVDLHVVEPSGREIYFGDPGPTPTGGSLDVDSVCGSDGNVENVRWPINAPNGNYTVRLDYFSSCGVTQSNYVVTVNNGGSTSRFTGNFTGSGDFGGLGSGRLITTFNHSASSLTTQSAPSAPIVLSPAALAKKAQAIAQGNRAP